MQSVPPTPSELWSIDEVSDYLGLTTRSVRRFIAGGQLHAYRIGRRHIRVARADVEALLVRIPTAADLDDLS